MGCFYVWMLQLALAWACVLVFAAYSLVTYTIGAVTEIII